MFENGNYKKMFLQKVMSIAPNFMKSHEKDFSLNVKESASESELRDKYTGKQSWRHLHSGR